MNRLRQLFAAALTAGVFAFAPPSLAQDDAAAEPTEQGVDDPSETTDAVVPADVSRDDAAAAAAEADAAMAEVELEDEPSPWTNGLIMSVIAMCIGGFSAVLGIWVDRDTARPKVFAYAMSFLILCALLVGVTQAYLDEVDHIEKNQDLERMLDMTYEIAVASGDPELIALVEQSGGLKVVGPTPAQTSSQDGPTPSEDGDAPAGDAAPAE